VRNRSPAGASSLHRGAAGQGEEIMDLGPVCDGGRIDGSAYYAS
jgi:hypothetical protein